MVLYRNKRDKYTQNRATIFRGGLWKILIRVVRVKRKLALLIKRHILLVFLLSVLAIVMLYFQCLQHPDTCIASFLKSKYHHLTKRSSKQVKCPWDYFIQDYNPLPAQIKMKDRNRKSFLSSLKLFGLLRFLKNSSYLTNKQSDIINSSIIMATTTSISKKNSKKHPLKNLTNKQSDMINSSIIMANNSKKHPKIGSDQTMFNLSKNNFTTEIERTQNSTIHFDRNFSQTNWSGYANNIIINKHGCDPLYPQIVLYNRIFKTGSTTTSQFFQNCSKKLKFHLKKDLTEQWSNERISHPILKRIQKRSKQRERKNEWNKRHKRRTKGLFVIAHFYFRKDLHVPRMNYTYINLLREPVERYISHYYYARSPLRWPKKLQRLKKLGHFNETLEECLHKQHEGCEWNHMTRFFCGPEGFCKNGTSKALKRAKYNMKHYYTSVGLLENLTEFLQVLHKRLPEFVVYNSELLGKQYVTTGVEKSVISDPVMKKVVEANKNDIELYKYAKILFTEQARECGIKIKK